MNKILNWLGLVDDGEPPRNPPLESRPATGDPVRPPQRPQIRPVGGEFAEPMAGRRYAEAAPTYRRPHTGVMPDLSVVARPGDHAGSMVGYTETIEVRGFDDAKKVADLLRERIPVVANFRKSDTDKARRLVDFLSGLAYGLDGTLRKVADGVLLVSPPRVKILERERRRLADLGLFDMDS